MEKYDTTYEIFLNNIWHIVQNVWLQIKQDIIKN